MKLVRYREVWHGIRRVLMAETWCGASPGVGKLKSADRALHVDPRGQGGPPKFAS